MLEYCVKRTALVTLFLLEPTLLVSPTLNFCELPALSCILTSIPSFQHSINPLSSTNEINWQLYVFLESQCDV